MPKSKNPQKIVKDLIFCQSGDILPNLVTLQTTILMTLVGDSAIQHPLRVCPKW